MDRSGGKATSTGIVCTGLAFRPGARALGLANSERRPKKGIPWAKNANSPEKLKARSQL
jgi:hypothetical protein